MPEIDISPEDLRSILDILRIHVPEYEVWAFGSRVSGAPREFSDLDLAVKTDKPLPPMRLVELKDAFCESDLHFRVDVVDWADISGDFRKIISMKYVVLRKPGGRGDTE